MNSVQVLGNLVRDPQVRYTKTSKPVASFTVASNRVLYSPTGEQHEMTDYVNITAWGAWAEAAGNQLHKGSRVFVEGRFSSHSYEAQDGSKRYVSEVIANMISVPLQTRTAEGGGGNFSQFGEVREDVPF